MPQPIIPDRLKTLRIRLNLTQEQLHQRSGITKDSINRLENGHQKGTRNRTHAGLARALDVDPRVLTGELPLPDQTGGPRARSQRNTGRSQIPVRVDTETRNALLLAARRYGIRMARIIELAPLLFVLTAEASLERRRSKLIELRELFASEDALRSDFSHLPVNIIPNDVATEAMAAEAKSIAANDVFADVLHDQILDHDAFMTVSNQYDPSEHNPFAAYLMEAYAMNPNVAEFRGCSRFAAHYQVCREDVFRLVGDDEALTTAILCGQILLSDMPRELWATDATEARLSWLNAKRAAYVATTPDPDEMLDSGEEGDAS